MMSNEKPIETIEKPPESLWIDCGDPLADPPENAEDEKPTKHRARSKKTFARIPYEQGLALLKHDIGSAGWAILIELDWLILKSGGCNPVPLASSKLRKYGLNHVRKLRALRRLEKAGVVRVEWRGNRAPLVMHLWYPPLAARRWPDK
jgi:hypothetical protein